MDLPSFFSGYVVPIVAVLGLLLSLINALILWKQNRPKISLDLSYEERLFLPNFGDLPYDCYILLVKNIGKVDIIVDIVGFKWGNGVVERDYYAIELDGECKELPFKLKTGGKLRIEFYKNNIEEQILKSGVSGRVKVICFFRDGDKRYYKASPIEIMVNTK